jgi:hypothetical protein
VRAFWLLLLCAGCTSETVRVVPWLKLQTKQRSSTGLTIPAGPGGIPHFSSATNVWSYLFLRTASSEWKKVGIDSGANFYVLAGGRSVVAGQMGKYVVFAEGKTDGKSIPEGCDLRIRADDSRIICAAVHGDRIDVTELDPVGNPVAAYSAEISASEYCRLDGLTQRCFGPRGRQAVHRKSAPLPKRALSALGAHCDRLALIG